jgi:hypothetical protein
MTSTMPCFCGRPGVKEEEGKKGGRGRERREGKT